MARDQVPDPGREHVVGAARLLAIDVGQQLARRRAVDREASRPPPRPPQRPDLAQHERVRHGRVATGEVSDPHSRLRKVACRTDGAGRAPARACATSSCSGAARCHGSRSSITSRRITGAGSTRSSRAGRTSTSTSSPTRASAGRIRACPPSGRRRLPPGRPSPLSDRGQSVMPGLVARLAARPLRRRRSRARTAA